MNRFNEKLAPEGYVAIRVNGPEISCKRCMYFSDKNRKCFSAPCTPDERPDRLDVYFVKIEEEGK